MNHQVMRHKHFSLQKGIVVLVLVLLTIATKVYAAQESEYIGKWQEIGKTEVIEFLEDGRCSITEGQEMAGGNWAMLQDGRVKININMMGMVYAATAVIRDGVLNFEFGGQVMKYKKMT